jgi:hypothetical protein
MSDPDDIFIADVNKIAKLLTLVFFIGVALGIVGTLLYVH